MVLLPSSAWACARGEPDVQVCAAVHLSTISSPERQRPRFRKLINLWQGSFRRGSKSIFGVEVEFWGRSRILVSKSKSNSGSISAEVEAEVEFDPAWRNRPRVRPSGSAEIQKNPLKGSALLCPEGGWAPGGTGRGAPREVVPQARRRAPPRGGKIRTLIHPLRGEKSWPLFPPPPPSRGGKKEPRGPFERTPGSF